MLALRGQLCLTSDFPPGPGAGSLPTAAALEGTTPLSPPWGFGGLLLGKPIE